MSKRSKTDFKCDFCHESLWHVEGADLGQEHYCYGCREAKSVPSGWGHKSELRDRHKTS